MPDDTTKIVVKINGKFSSTFPKKEEMEWHSYAPNDLDVNARYKLGISAVVPRPVAVITSIPSGEEGRGNNARKKQEEKKSLDENDRDNDPKDVVNCAPFSYTGLLSHDPPMVAHGICLTRAEDGTRTKKDTLVNIEQSKEWVFNVLSESYLEQANACSEALPYGASEVDKNNLSTLPSIICKTPRLAQAMVSMECVLDSLKEVHNDEGEHTTTIVMGKIVRYHIHSTVLKEHNNGIESSPVVDLERLRSVGRVGDITYWPTGEGKAVAMERPK